MNRHAAGAVVVAMTVLAAEVSSAGRYEDLTRWAAEGPTMSLESATFLGTPSAENAVAVVPLPDKSVVVAGNAYGPAFFATMAPRILGKGSHSGAEPFTMQKDRKVLKPYTPDMCGMLLVLTPDLRKVTQITRFQWGVATISAAALSQDRKALILGGYCKPDALKDVVPAARLKTYAQPAPEVPADGRRRTPPAAGPAPAYVMRLTLGGAPQAEWCWVMEGATRVPEQLWQDKLGNVFFALDGFTQILADGSDLKKLTTKGNLAGQSGIRGFDPLDGGYFYGGDRNTHTGYQPWRQPFLYKCKPTGEKVWDLWGWDPKKCACGGTGNGLCSDASIRDVQVAPNGDLIMIGWSDGGNSVFTRQPYNLDLGAANATGPFTTWGMKVANSLAYVLRIDGKSHAQTAWSYFIAYVPDTFADASHRGAPNGVSIDALRVLGDGTVALTGGAATGLISTPNAFYIHKGPGKYGGKFAAVLNQDFSQMLFSSYLPGYESVTMAPVDGGVVVAGTARRDDGRTDQAPTPPPLKEALQSAFGGGQFDLHLMLLKSPRVP